MKDIAKKILENSPLARKIYYELRGRKIELAQELERHKTWVPPGHFFSPIPDANKLKQNEKKIWHKCGELKAIDLNEAEQLELFRQLSRFYGELPFGDEKRQGLRYYYQNPSYLYSDAIFLYSMLRHLRPKQVVEAGSGFSSAVMLDTNELFLGGSARFTFIEPYPDLFLSLIKDSDKGRFELIRSDLQDVALGLFESLEPNDILFIDSTHVSKTGSDVNYIFFEILPILKSGVYVHFHDIFYPFEYPREWVYEGRAWNEAYLLRAFLQYNEKFRIVAYNTWLAESHRELLEKNMPLSLKNTGGALWLRKV